MNAQTPGPLFLGRGSRIQTRPAPANGRILADMTHSDQRDLTAEARLFAASYTAFDKAGRALGVDAAQLAESLDLTALIRLAMDTANGVETSQEWAAEIVARLPSVS